MNFYIVYLVNSKNEIRFIIVLRKNSKFKKMANEAVNLVHSYCNLFIDRDLDLDLANQILGYLCNFVKVNFSYF
jgi:hypothetical protein